MSLRILLVGNYPQDQQKSMTAFARMMEHCLVEDGHIVKILNPTACLLSNNRKPSGFWKWIGYIDKFIIFPRALRREAKKFDLVHICDHSNAMYALTLKNIPIVITCHDVLAIEAARNMIPGWSVGFMGKIFQWLIFQGLKQAAAVVCVSEYTKSHLQNLGWNGANISVALNSLNDDFFPDDYLAIKEAVQQTELSVGTKYLIHVGSDLPRKNRLFILKIFNVIKRLYPDTNFKLLFVGPPLSEEMIRLSIDNELGDSVLSIQNTPHKMLRALYSGAVGLIFPSLQEGFGWPIIEAQACGCPVFTSHILPMTEVGGDGAIYVDPLDEHIAANKIIESLNDLESIRHRGFENLKRFSKQNMASSYLSAYTHATGGAKC
ncbi:glycosyltransferase family 4 protein [Glaciimonas sp. GG7]